MRLENILPEYGISEVIYGMDGTQRYWLEKLLYTGWIYIGLMLFIAGGLSKFWHLIPLALGLCMLQNYLVEKDKEI